MGDIKDFITKYTMAVAGKRAQVQAELGSTMIKWQCDGLTEEQWARWHADPLAIAATLNQRMTYEDLPEDEGHRVSHQKMNMPLVLSNRSVITTFYRPECADGYQCLMHSSRGNDEIAAANADKIGSDVIANNHIVHVTWKAYEGGMEINMVQKMDLAGSIPTMFVNKMSGRLANALQLLVDYLQNGTVPEPLF